jgi:hypothetical protein
VEQVNKYAGSKIMQIGSVFSNSSMRDKSLDIMVDEQKVFIS